MNDIITEDLVNAMVTDVLQAIVDQYGGRRHSYNMSAKAAANYIKRELDYNLDDIKDFVIEVWDDVAHNLCNNDAGYWEKKYGVTHLATEEIVNNPMFQKEIIRKIKAVLFR